MKRQTAEKKIVGKLVDLLLNQGFSITVECEDDLIKKSTDKSKIMEEVFQLTNAI